MLNESKLSLLMGSLTEFYQNIFFVRDDSYHLQFFGFINFIILLRDPESFFLRHQIVFFLNYIQKVIVKVEFASFKKLLKIISNYFLLIALVSSNFPK
jgi:hypothetical protein